MKSFEYQSKKHANTTVTTYGEAAKQEQYCYVGFFSILNS